MPTQNPSDDKTLATLLEIRNWIRAAAHRPVREALEEALPDAKSRAAYQMLDGKASIEHVRTACKMSPNAVVGLAARCVSAGLMELSTDNRKARLFDLADFGLLADGEPDTKATR